MSNIPLKKRNRYSRSSLYHLQESLRYL